MSTWMLNISDNQCISKLSIPGTHDSGALFETVEIQDTTICQSLSIPEQLEIGVRAFDIRCHHKNNNLYIHHRDVYQNATFRDVLSMFALFLNNHPSEGLVVSVKEEYQTMNCIESFSSSVLRDTLWACENQGLKWLRSSSLPQMGELRGKLLYVCRFNISNCELNSNSSKNIDIDDFIDGVQETVSNTTHKIKTDLSTGIMGLTTLDIPSGFKDNSTFSIYSDLNSIDGDSGNSMDYIIRVQDEYRVTLKCTAITNSNTLLDDTNIAIKQNINNSDINTDNVECNCVNCKWSKVKYLLDESITLHNSLNTIGTDSSYINIPTDNVSSSEHTGNLIDFYREGHSVLYMNFVSGFYTDLSGRPYISPVYSVVNPKLLSYLHNIYNNHIVENANLEKHIPVPVSTGILLCDFITSNICDAIIQLNYCTSNTNDTGSS